MPNVLTTPTFSQRKAASSSNLNQSLANLAGIHNATVSAPQSQPAPGAGQVGNQAMAPITLKPGQTMVDGQILGPNQLTKFQFRQLFTLNERIAVDNAPMNMALPAQARAACVTLNKDLEVSGIVDLDLPQTQQGVQFLVSIGLLTQARANRILANQLPE